MLQDLEKIGEMSQKSSFASSAKSIQRSAGYPISSNVNHLRHRQTAVYELVLAKE